MSDQETPDWADLAAQTLLKESDRGCAIFAAEYLSEVIEQLLRAYFRNDPEDVNKTIDPLFSGYGPLATFSARIQLAYSLGILPRLTRDRIEIIRRLRNDFAHQWGPLDFKDPRCAARLALLVDLDTAAEPTPTEPRAPDPKGEQLVARLAFALRVCSITGTLKYLAGLAREGKDVRRAVELMESEQSGRQLPAGY